MLKRLCALLCALMLLIPAARADIHWPQSPTPAQSALAAYVTHVNAQLEAWGQKPIDSLFECYPTFAVMGVAASDAPEDVQMHFTLHDASLNALVLRANDAETFRWLAAACVQGSAPEAITPESALDGVNAILRRVEAAPGNSFEDAVDPLNGTSPRAYYAYYPNQYRDGVSWLQLTLIFPLAGYGNAMISATPTPPPASSAEYEGYDFDGGTHLEIFTTATPEPDSAAGEAGF